MQICAKFKEKTNGQAAIKKKTWQILFTNWPTKVKLLRGNYATDLRIV